MKQVTICFLDENGAIYRDVPASKLDVPGEYTVLRLTSPRDSRRVSSDLYRGASPEIAIGGKTIPSWAWDEQEGMVQFYIPIA